MLRGYFCVLCLGLFVCGTIRLDVLVLCFVTFEMLYVICLLLCVCVYARCSLFCEEM
jgi:hypothetical protein